MVARLKNLWNRRPWIFFSAAAVVLIVAAFGAVRLARSAPNVPTADVQLTEFVDRVQVRCEVKALKSVVLSAPSNAGEIQIIKLMKNGSQVQPGDMVAQFDSTQLQRQLEQRRTELKQADAEIERTRAQRRLTEEQILTDLAQARYNVERARLELSKQEILSQIEGEKNRIALDNAEQRLKEVEERLQNTRIAIAADVESRRQRREKALFDLQQVERQMATMSLKAPSTGMITLLPNGRGGRGMMFGPGGAPEFKEGDRAWPGAAIAELPDLGTIRVNGRVDESDRGRVKIGQDANIRVDAVPDKELTGRLVDISPLAKPDFSSWPPTKNFDLSIQIDQPDPRLRPGMSATARVAVERLPNSIVIPPDAAFNKFGRTVAYVLRGSKFEERAIEIIRRGSGQLVISKGLKPGEKVALKDPTIEVKEE